MLATTGCLAPSATAGRDADASIAGLRAELRDVNAALLQMRTEIRAGRDVNQNDSWTLRLLGLGVLMLGLSYPVGKIIWITTSTVARRGGPKPPGPTIPAQADFVPFRDGLSHRADLTVRA